MRDKVYYKADIIRRNVGAITRDVPREIKSLQSGHHPL